MKHSPSTAPRRKRRTRKDRVLAIFPRAHAVQYAGEWHVYSGDEETGNTCIGSGLNARDAWDDAELNTR